ncbi:CASP-like protein 1F1 [Phoenix dactylifera]|uniref:CASP-like protein n=1 Tax=Phoenix dactylifera TaxID=42345 RepID=A0A8B9ACY6_PHODC|nr:CASP-like protein 1F1 [Phoenix dactylifera]
MKMDQDRLRNAHNKYVSAHALFRLLAGATTLAAALVMGLNKETKSIAGYQMVASYKTSPAFEFFLVGNAITCGYTIASLPFVSKLVEGYLLDLLDLVSLVLLMASASAATAIGYLGKEGNDQIGWMKVCPYYEKFCNGVAISLVFSYVGLLFLLLICVLSSVYKTRQSNKS